jgi:hypothetical protein
VISLLRQLTARRDLARVLVEKPGFRLELRRTGRAAGAAGRMRTNGSGAQ